MKCTCVPSSSSQEGAWWQLPSSMGLSLPPSRRCGDGTMGIPLPSIQSLRRRPPIQRGFRSGRGSSKGHCFSLLSASAVGPPPGAASTPAARLASPESNVSMTLSTSCSLLSCVGGASATSSATPLLSPQLALLPHSLEPSASIAASMSWSVAPTLKPTASISWSVAPTLQSAALLMLLMESSASKAASMSCQCLISVVSPDGEEPARTAHKASWNALSNLCSSSRPIM
mmetsp:Transcript_12110/g.32996  ORF Transcript_12110/g.32996 Transcript_12110/m.32996 type:complete len:229 (+) Transcript_12110:244-930(+)